ncbi:ribose-phosphate diphosphokinase [Solimonas flava]|uniref:ribose-phosphate diphosphokinase n=1 Tax=Solimonas flava TaxID=415849 RepID=UPI0003F8BF5C|nr:ribose-phosphate diphosphokinase [Solimonas flava]
MRSAPLVCALPGNAALAYAVATHCGGDLVELALHRFPDGETGMRVLESPARRDVIVVCSLNDPDPKMAALHFAAATLREHGARRLLLVAPYLAYMRQDRAFEPGVGTLARHYARWLSGLFDAVLTVDPHLHRIHRLNEIFDVPAQVVAAAPDVAAWIAAHCSEPPLLVGPDGESAQWVADVAARLGCPSVAFTKQRRGDADVLVHPAALQQHRGRRAVVVDDIVSTAATMIGAVEGLREQGFAAPLCIAVHPLFAGDAYVRLQAAGAGAIVSCNTIVHPSNGIDLHVRLATAVDAQLRALEAPESALGATA